MCEYRLRNRSAGTIGHGTALGAAGYVCASARYAHHTKTPNPEKPECRILNLSLQLGSCHSKEVRRGRQICGEGLRFDGENVHHPNPAIWCTGPETNFRVTVAGHESNCKILA